MGSGASIKDLKQPKEKLREKLQSYFLLFWLHTSPNTIPEGPTILSLDKEVMRKVSQYTIPSAHRVEATVSG